MFAQALSVQFNFQMTQYHWTIAYLVVSYLSIILVIRHEVKTSVAPHSCDQKMGNFICALLAPVVFPMWLVHTIFTKAVGY
jgi:hypothetical protein